MSTATHPFVSAVADDADSSSVSPTDWNAIHYETIAAGGNQVEVDHFALTTRLISAGAARLTLREPLTYFKGAYGLGTLEITNDTYILQYKRATLAGNARLTTSGNGELFLFDLAPVGRLVLAGRGGN